MITEGSLQNQELDNTSDDDPTLDVCCCASSACVCVCMRVCVCGGFRTFGITQNHAIYVIRIKCNSTLEELPFFCSQQNEG